ncbi:hypothetical protein BST40_28425, partial [Mycobacterium persicum]
TGAFNTGNMNNGILWRADSHGLLGATYTITIPEIPLHAVGTIPINIPITSTITNVVYSGMTMSDIPFGFTVGFGPIPAFTGKIDSLTIPQVEVLAPVPAPHGAIGGPNTVVEITSLASIGPVDWTIFSFGGQPGFGNSTTAPSSGFFNSGTGSSSGFFNSGANNSGLTNIDFGNSGVLNIGVVQSGIANLGNSISGFINTGPPGFSSPAAISGLHNVGTSLAGFLRDGTNGTTFNIGLANQGGLNLGSANVGDLNLGSGNIGSFNLGSANIGSFNLGLANTGSHNNGNDNTGTHNIGIDNTGNHNLGICNTA